MKKIMALVLVLAMALAMMAGCSSNQKPAETAPAAAGNTEAANAPRGGWAAPGRQEVRLHPERCVQ